MSDADKFVFVQHIFLLFSSFNIPDFINSLISESSYDMMREDFKTPKTNLVAFYNSL